MLKDKKAKQSKMFIIYFNLVYDNFFTFRLVAKDKSRIYNMLL